MSNNPINLLLRFVLEISGLIIMGYWGWTEHTGFVQILFGIGIPLFAAVIWGTFRVPGDPKDAPVPVSGRIRLFIEFVFFGTGIYLLAISDKFLPAIVYIGVLILHYTASYDRIQWLLRKKADV